MLKHGIDRLAARAQLASNPFRQLRAIHPLHAVISKMDQDLRTMPPCCPTGKVITGYLASLDMVLEWQAVDRLGLPRATQLANKTNQFNLTTRRYTEAQMAALVEDPAALVLQFRLRDRYGDNGVIAVIVASPAATPGTLVSRSVAKKKAVPFPSRNRVSSGSPFGSRSTTPAPARTTRL